jgi:hypothetical protein
VVTAPSQKRSKRAKPLAEAAIQLQERDLQLLLYAYELHAFTQQEAYRLCYGENLAQHTPLSPSVCYRRLGLLTQHRLLSARRAPAATSRGSAPYIYCLGPRAVPLLADRLGLPAEVIARRIRQDQQLAWRLFEHIHGLAQVHTAFICACRERGYVLEWRSDQALAANKLVAHEGGVSLPLQPDAFFTVTRPAEGLRSCFFIELQIASRPSDYRGKARAYLAYTESGTYIRDFGYRSIVVLGITSGSQERALNLKHAAEDASGRSLFWSSTVDELLAEPFGRIWQVAGQPDERRYEIFGYDERGDNDE